mgnify:FL=1
MYTISSKVYLEVAERLSALIGFSHYYSGSFEIDFGEVTCRMVLSAVVYRHQESFPEGRIVDIIDNVVPVWWEFHTVTEEGEVINDFDFAELKEYLLNM